MYPGPLAQSGHNRAQNRALLLFLELWEESQSSKDTGARLLACTVSLYVSEGKILLRKDRSPGTGQIACLVDPGSLREFNRLPGST